MSDLTVIKRYPLVALTEGQQDYVIAVIKKLARELQEVKRGYDQSIVDTAIDMVRGKPPGDPT